MAPSTNGGEWPILNMVLSAAVGEVAHRSISFLLEKFSNPVALPAVEENLRCKLLRVRVIVEEAEGRQIGNQVMLEQLKMLQQEMYRCYYVLDTFRHQAHEEEKDNAIDDHGVSDNYSFALSKFNPAKRVQLFVKSSQGVGELKQVIASVEIMVSDLNEFVTFLRGCPPLYRRPYSTYMLMEKCMFGRHVEMERIINFLLQNGSPGAANLGILPVIGPAKVGKSTLIEHACNDERVRKRFSRIVLFTGDDLKDEMLIRTLGDGGIIKYQNRTSGEERILVIIEINGDIDEGVWRRLYSTYESRVGHGSKIIISSRSDKIASFGTARALKVEFFTREAYWYFFKVLAFGNTDPEEKPRLASIAMEMAMELNGSFICGNVCASLLRANPNAIFWGMVLASVRECRKKCPFMFGADPVSPSQEKKLVHIRIINRPIPEYCTILDEYQKGFPDQDEADNYSKITTMQQVLSGSTRIHGKFEALAWRSHIPPHYSYIYSCEIRKPQRLLARKKSFQKSSR